MIRPELQYQTKSANLAAECAHRARKLPLESPHRLRLLWRITKLREAAQRRLYPEFAK